jgi:hypothetical protein
MSDEFDTNEIDALSGKLVNIFRTIQALPTDEQAQYKHALNVTMDEVGGVAMARHDAAKQEALRQAYQEECRALATSGKSNQGLRNQLVNKYRSLGLRCGDGDFDNPSPIAKPGG